MARLTRSRRTAGKAETSDSVQEPETAPPPEKRTRRGRKNEVKPVEQPAAPASPPPPPPVEEKPELVEEQKMEEDVPKEPVKKKGQKKQEPKVEEPVEALPPEPKAKKIEVEEEKLDFEVEDELQLKAQKDADIDEDTDETSKDQVSPPTAGAGEEKLSALDEMLKKRMSRRQSSVVDKENRKDRWGKLAEKAPVNESRTQTVVTTDSLKELSAELEKEQNRKKSTEETATKEVPQTATDGKVTEETQEKTEEDKSKQEAEKKSKDDEMDQKRKARHISMGDDNSSKTESTNKSSYESRKAPTAGMALGTTNWEDLESHRRKPRDEATPAREQPSVYLLVNNLVRPFTLAQLTDFISHGNERVVTDLWLDKIKSKAIATFETSEMSEKAREELHNLVWPKGSPKTIKCEFLTAEQVEETKNPSEATKVPLHSEREVKKEAKIESKEDVSRHRDRSENGKGDGDDLRKTLETHKDKDRLIEDRHHRHNRDERDERDESFPAKKIREWDLPKIQMQQKRQKEEPIAKEEPPKKDADESPCLETFFKKTLAMPPLYWLPLNEEQAIEKAKSREAKQKEDDRQKLRQLRKNRRF